MRLRNLPFLCLPLLAWLAAGARARAHPRELVAWTAAVETSESPARVADLRTLLRTLAARPSDRRAAPRESDPPVALHVAVHIATLPRSLCRATELPSADSSTRELAFPYDATAPPARA